MTKFESVWIIPWSEGRIGVAYRTESGGKGMREFLENDPDAPAMRQLLSPADERTLAEHLEKDVVKFRTTKQ